MTEVYNPNEGPHECEHCGAMVKLKPVCYACGRDHSKEWLDVENNKLNQFKENVKIVKYGTMGTITGMTLYYCIDWASMLSFLKNVEFFVR